VRIHPTAVVDPAAQFAPDVEVGPFCVVGPRVVLGPGCRLGVRVSLLGEIRAGARNRFHDHASLGSGGGTLEIGDDNVFGGSAGVAAGGAARIGSRNAFRIWSVVGEGCRIGNDAVIGAFVMLGPGVVVEDGARLAGQNVVRRGARLGRGCRVLAQCPVDADVPPYARVDGNPQTLKGAAAWTGSAALDRVLALFAEGHPISAPEADDPRVREFLEFLARPAVLPADAEGGLG
jgi:UDP-N-acetylglucosamine acyltransferase